MASAATRTLLSRPFAGLGLVLMLLNCFIRFHSQSGISKIWLNHNAFYLSSANVQCPNLARTLPPNLAHNTAKKLLSVVYAFRMAVDVLAVVLRMK